MILSIIVILSIIIIMLVIFLLVRTLTFARPFDAVEPIEGILVDGKAVAKHLAAVIRCETVTHENEEENQVQPFEELHAALKKMYPKLHKTCHLEIVAEAALLYTWQGTNLDLPPVLFAAHQDVVPVDPSSLSQWEHAPFSGDIDEEYVRGRGAIDIKSQMITTLEAAEKLIAGGYQPDRTVYFAFGHDEEVGGTHGAQNIVKLLQERDVRLAAVIDEGGFIVSGTLPGVKVPVALIGIGEKGYLTLEFSVTAAPGHSSTPPSRTAIGSLARAMIRLEENQMPTRPIMVRPLFKGVGIAAPFFIQLAFSNLWLFKGLLRARLEENPQTNAAIRTTTAITMMNAGIKDNILPDQAKASVNFRVLPGNTIADVCEHVRKVIDDDQVKFEPKELSAWEPSPVSLTDSPEFEALATTIRQVFGNVPVAPYLVLGATDSRYYAAICDNVYRFTPAMITPDDLARVHAINERISIENLVDMVNFFAQLIQTWSKGAE